MPTKRSPRGLKRKIKEEKENLDQVDIKNETDEFDGESDDDLAEYEQRRLQNIADRKNKIDELKIADISLELAAGLNQETKGKAISRRGLSAVPRQKEVLPPRPKSLRLQNINADTGLQLPEKEPTHYQVYSEREEIPRLPLEDLSLEELCSNTEDCETTSNYFDTKVKPFIEEDKKSKLATSIFDNVGTLGKNLKKLKITGERVAKVVPDRIFSLAIHPTETKLLVAAGGKWGSIGFWDVQDNESKTHGVQLIKVFIRIFITQLTLCTI